MPRKVKPLTDVQIRKAKPKDKAYVLRDGDGLELHIKPGGAKLWRLRYRRPDGRRNMLALGRYPDITLTTARKLAAEARALVEQGIDPAEQRKAAREEAKAKAREHDQVHNPPFSRLFDEWFEIKAKSWSDANARKMLGRGRKHLVAHLGDKPVRSLTRDDFFAILECIDREGHAETRNRVKQMAFQIMDYALTKGYRSDNPVASITNQAFSKSKPKNRAHTTDPKALRAILRDIERHRGDASIRAALRLLPHLPLRASELAGLRWSEVDLKARMIAIPKERMKKERPYKTFISSYVYEVLTEQYERFGGISEYVFPSQHTMLKPINPESLGNALRKKGYKDTQSVHGFRHTMMTLLNEMGYDRHLVRIQLSHRLENETEAVYNKADYLRQRQQMMEDWSQWLEALKRADESELHRFVLSEPVDDGPEK